jgi:hypothetical protein
MNDFRLSWTDEETGREITREIEFSVSARENAKKLLYKRLDEINLATPDDNPYCNLMNQELLHEAITFLNALDGDS